MQASSPLHISEQPFGQDRPVFFRGFHPCCRAIGRYGNGFKAGSMRLGKDALALTKCATSQSAGFLSQSFLQVPALMLVLPERQQHFAKNMGAICMHEDHILHESQMRLLACVTL